MGDILVHITVLTPLNIAGLITGNFVVIQA